MPRSRAALQTSSRYLERDSPPYKASEYCGQIMHGNDGNLWISVENSAKTFCQWREYHDEETPAERERRSIEKVARRESKKKVAEKRASAKRNSAKRTSAKRGSAKRASANKRVSPARIEYANVPTGVQVYDSSDQKTSRPYRTGDYFETKNNIYVRKGRKWVIN
jgi:hypothetical protein